MSRNVFFVILTFSAVTAGAVFVMQCASSPAAPQPAADRGGDLAVITHAGVAEGMQAGQLPVWLDTYLHAGITGLEALPDYEDNYCFVAETTVPTLDAVTAWVASHPPTRDISRQVADWLPRLHAALAEAYFGGVREVNRWWIQVRGKEFRGYIFCVIDQEVLDREMRDVMQANNFILTKEEQELWNNRKF
jgi:hypothetical protein